MTIKRKTMTKALHTVTVVSRLGHYLMEYDNEKSASSACKRAISILGIPGEWDKGDPVFDACVARLKVIRA